MRNFSLQYDETTAISTKNADYIVYLVDDFCGADALSAAVFGDVMAIFDEDGIIDSYPIMYGVRSRKMREFLCSLTCSCDPDFSHIEIEY